LPWANVQRRLEPLAPFVSQVRPGSARLFLATAQARFARSLQSNATRLPVRAAQKHVIKVFVCANSSVELAGLEALVRASPSLELVGSSLGRAGLSQAFAVTRPDVLLERSALDDLEESRFQDWDAKTVPGVLLVAEPEFTAAIAAMQAVDSALRGILPTYTSEREIQIAIEAVAEGLFVLHPDVAEHAVTASGAPRASTASFGQQLSPRESEILNLLAAGLGNKEIAWRLKISDHTVKFHVTSIFNKLSASSRAEAVAIGIRRGLIVL
jgi:two-component system, NarL family, response regulator YdfI